MLDRLEATLAPREPALAELARELRWRTCDEPLVDASRDETYALMEEHVAALADDPEREDRDELLDALVDCPQPLAPLLGRRIGHAGPLVEAMTRRYYRIRPLEHVEQRLVEGVPFVLAAYEHLGVRHHVAATLGEPDDLAGRAARARRARARRCRPARCCWPTSTPATGDRDELERAGRRGRACRRRSRGVVLIGPARRVHVLARPGRRRSSRTATSAACTR